VTRVLDGIVAERGQPLAIRCDNGPELTSRHFLAWCVERQIELVHIQPGKPTQNAHAESFHGRLREECLTVSWFQNLFDARRKIAAWRKEQRGASAQQPGIPNPQGICCTGRGG
jgi:putative transposase